jgi:F-type H+-transporting ATPase subunit c
MEMSQLALAFAYLAAGLGAGIVTFGAGIGIRKIASSAMDGTARQPEAGGAIRITMIIAAAMIEGVALFGAVVCFLLASK